MKKGKKQKYKVLGEILNSGLPEGQSPKAEVELPLPETVSETYWLLRRSEAHLGMREFRITLATHLPPDVKNLALDILAGSTTNDLLEQIVDQDCTGRMPHESDFKDGESTLRKLLRQIQLVLTELK